MAQTKEQKAVVREWVKNLESGLYKQGKSALVTLAGESNNNKDDKFCCFGVLCDMAVVEGVIGDPTEFGNNLGYGEIESTAFLPQEVMDWAGIASPDGVYTDDRGNSHTLAGRNDRGASFKKIAEIIKSNPEGLFV